MSELAVTYKWISLAEALDRVSRELQSRENAKVQLREALEGAKLAARAELIETNSSFFVGDSFVEGTSSTRQCRQPKDVPPGAWKLSNIEWEQSGFERRAIAFQPNEHGLGADLCGYIGRDVEVPRSQVDGLWSQQEQANPRSRAKRNKPGRPHGSGYSVQDRPLLKEMRQLIQKKQVSSITAAARSVEKRAAGSVTNRAKRLADRYRETYEEK